MERIGIRKLQQTLTKVLSAVESGAWFTIYRHKRAVALIVPADAVLAAAKPEEPVVEDEERDPRFWPEGMG